MSLVNDILLNISKFCDDYGKYVIHRYLLKIKPENLQKKSHNETQYLYGNYYILENKKFCILNVHFPAFKFIKFSINRYTAHTIQDMISSHFNYDALKEINIFNVKNLHSFDITENMESVNLTIANSVLIKWPPRCNLTYLKCKIKLDEFFDNYAIYLNIKNLELTVVNANNYLYISKICNVIDTLIITFISNYTILEYFNKFEIKKLSLRKIVNVAEWIPYIDNLEIDNLEIEIGVNDIPHISQLKNKITSVVLNITKKLKITNKVFANWINLNKLTICNSDEELHLDCIYSSNITKLSIEEAKIPMQAIKYLHNLHITELSFTKCNFIENNLNKIVLPNTVTKFIYKDSIFAPIISIRHNIDDIHLILNAKHNILDILDVGIDNKIKTLNLEIIDNSQWNDELLLKSNYKIDNLIINTGVIAINCSLMNTKNIEICYCNVVLPPYLDTLVAKYGCIFNEIEIKHIKLAKLLYMGKYEYKYSDDFLSKIDLIIFV